MDGLRAELQLAAVMGLGLPAFLMFRDLIDIVPLIDEANRRWLALKGQMGRKALRRHMRL